MKTLTKIDAEGAGYRAVTVGFHLPKEEGMLNTVLADMRRGNIDHVVVTVPTGVAVWRRGVASSPVPLCTTPRRIKWN
jgi:hypothetical protein